MIIQNTKKDHAKTCKKTISMVCNRRKHEQIDFISLKRLPDTDDSWRAWKQKGKYLQG